MLQAGKWMYDRNIKLNRTAIHELTTKHNVYDNPNGKEKFIQDKIESKLVMNFNLVIV